MGSEAATFRFPNRIQRSYAFQALPPEATVYRRSHVSN